jgi:hypothetical protein
VARVSRFVPQNRQLRFGDLDLKFSAMFLSLGLKTKQTSGCRLRHKILMAYFAWKQVALGFFSLASRLAEAR